ncbi:hypothetical protein RKD48_002091 [Streptomyces ambofaciens]
MSPDRWDFISDHRAAFGVQRICRVLGVSRSGYYQQQATAQARAARQAEQGRRGRRDPADPRRAPWRLRRPAHPCRT